jgi:aspartate-semialdehyde dehydrogenase
VSLRIGVVGATGAVGTRLLSILEERAFGATDLRLFASERSRGRKIATHGRLWECDVLSKGCFSGLDWVFFDASDEISKQWVPEALSSGARVIDNSAVYRMDPGVVLGVPEVNGEAIQAAARSGARLFAGPNCSTVQLTVALRPLASTFGLKRVLVSTYQSVSGAGSAAMDELKAQMAGGSDRSIFPHQIAANLIPRIGKVQDDGFTSEEQKLMLETRKILALPRLPIAATAVRVPTFLSHAESAFVELERAATLDQVIGAWKRAPGLEWVDDPGRDLYPTNENTSNRDTVSVGRLRLDPSVESGVCFWVVSDNLRKGAALNAVQIAESIRAAV